MPPSLRSIALNQVIWGPGPRTHRLFLNMYEKLYPNVFGVISLRGHPRGPIFFLAPPKKMLKSTDFWILDSSWSLRHDCTFLVMKSLRHNPYEVTHKISAHLGH